MPDYEKLNGLLLFEKVEEDPLSSHFIAGRISGNQIKQLQIVKRFKSSFSATDGFVTDLHQELDDLHVFSNPNVICPRELIQVGASVAAVLDYIEGKTLRQVLTTSTLEGVPFT